MKLIVGLGNPGKQYENNRHNLGFKVIDYFAKEERINLSKIEFGGNIYKGKISDVDVIISKPITFINKSGDFVRKIVNYYKIDLDDILIIYDDKDIMMGKFKLKDVGNFGGHNGVKDIIANLHTNRFPRLKCGIGHEKLELKILDFVLQDFPQSDWKIVEANFKIYCELIKDFLENDFKYISNKYNSLKLS